MERWLEVLTCNLTLLNSDAGWDTNSTGLDIHDGSHGRCSEWLSWEANRSCLLKGLHVAHPAWQVQGHQTHPMEIQYFEIHCCKRTKEKMNAFLWPMLSRNYFICHNWVLVVWVANNDQVRKTFQVRGTILVYTMGGIDYICVGLFQDSIVLQWPLIKSLHNYHIVLFKVSLKLLFLKIRKCKSSKFVFFHNCVGISVWIFKSTCQFLQKSLYNFDWDCVKFIDHFSENNIESNQWIHYLSIYLNLLKICLSSSLQ